MMMQNACNALADIQHALARAAGAAILKHELLHLDDKDNVLKVRSGRGGIRAAGPELDLARQRTRRLDEIASTLRNIAAGPGLVLA
jgi:hypothetical protein